MKPLAMVVFKQRAAGGRPAALVFLLIGLLAIADRRHARPVPIDKLQPVEKYVPPITRIRPGYRLLESRPSQPLSHLGEKETGKDCVYAFTLKCRNHQVELFVGCHVANRVIGEMILHSQTPGQAISQGVQKARRPVPTRRSSTPPLIAMIPGYTSAPAKVRNIIVCRPNAPGLGSMNDPLKVFWRAK